MRRILILLMLSSGLAAASTAGQGAAAPLAPTQPAPNQTQADEHAPGLHELISEIVRSNVPHEYQDTKRWGGTKEVFDGLRISRDGLRIKTKRRKKAVNHGTWKRYHVRLADPQEELQVRVEQIGPSGDGRLEFDVVFVARLALFGRLSQWQTGIQLISLSADAEARVKLRVTCRLAVRLDSTKFPPDVVLDPEATAAELEIVEFRLQRISNLKGPLVKELGSELQEVLEKKVAEKQARLVQEINRQIDKRRDSLRLSLHDAIKSKWSELAEPFGRSRL